MEEALTAAGAQPRDLTDVAVGVGPGPFTGLRVGVVTALTLASSLDLRAHGVCSLDVIAAETDLAGPFVVTTDARRKEVYFALYDHGQRIEGPAVGRPEVVAEVHRGVPVFGRGTALYPEVFEIPRGPLDPSAEALAAGVIAGRFTEVPLEPMYLRRPDVTPSAVPKRA
jgi:tRNA threonylcarbamoyl adenosine modification protein YeaZ